VDPLMKVLVFTVNALSVRGCVETKVSVTCTLCVPA